MTLVISGSFTDGADLYGPGDIQDVDETVSHTPVAGAGEMCVCLAVSDAPLRFNRLLPRLAQKIARI